MEQISIYVGLNLKQNPILVPWCELLTLVAIKLKLARDIIFWLK